MVQGLKVQVSEAVLQQAWRGTPAATAVRWSGGQWRMARHLEYLSDRIAMMVERPIRLLISIPPQHGKSELTSHWTPSWFLPAWPNRKVLLGSYSDSVAARWGRATRDTFIANPGMGVRLNPSTQAADEWETVEGGGMKTAGVGGGLTGYRADLLIIDDPHKDAAEAASPTIRKQIQDWYSAVARQRLTPDGSIIINHTRWDEDDLIGWILANRQEGDEWEVIKLPQYAEGNDALGREVGDILWPERFTPEQIRKIRRDMANPDLWDALHQQRPNPRGRGYYFDLEAVRGLEVHITAPVEIEKGGLVRRWKPPVVGGRYVWGADCAWGERGAYGVFIMEDFVTRDTVAEIYGRPALDEFAHAIMGEVSHYAAKGAVYGGVERNGEGAKVAEKLMELGLGPDRMFYHDHLLPEPKRPGWQTDSDTRPVLLTDLEEMVRRRGIFPKCQDEITEMLHFVRDEKGKPVPASGFWSDHIFARGILGQMRKYARFRRPAGYGIMTEAVHSRW